MRNPVRPRAWTRRRSPSLRGVVLATLAVLPASALAATGLGADAAPATVQPNELRDNPMFCPRPGDGHVPVTALTTAPVATGGYGHPPKPCGDTDMKKAKLTVVKVLTGAAPDDRTPFAFTVTGIPGFTLTGGTERGFALPPGERTVAEDAPPPGYAFTSGVCTDRAGTAIATGQSMVVALTRGAHVRCVFTNAGVPVTPPTPPAPPVAPPDMTPPAVTPPAPPAGGAAGIVTPTPRARPALAITKAAPARARALQRITYTIRVRNTGAVPARGPVLTDRLPSGLTFVRATAGGTFRAGVVTVRLGTLRPKQVRTVRITVRAPADIRGTRVNRARVRAVGVRPVSARAATAFRPLVRRVLPAITG